MDKDRVLITGGSGLLGSNTARMLSNDFEVYATYNTHPSQISGCRFLFLNITDKDQVVSVAREIKPSLIIHASGLINVDFCETNEDDAWAINVYGTENVAIASQEFDAKLVYVSTDSVFDGRKGSYTEEDMPNPLSIYAKSKFEGEKRAQQMAPNSIIVRTAFYGWSLYEKPSLAEWVLNSLREGKSPRMWTDVYFSPIYVGSLIEVMISMFRNDLRGIYHVGGSESCSKYSFGRMIASVFGFDADIIEPTSIDEAQLKAPRPRNLSLNTSKVSMDQDVRLLNVQEGISLFKKSAPVRLESNK